MISNVSAEETPSLVQLNKTDRADCLQLLQPLGPAALQNLNSPQKNWFTWNYSAVPPVIYDLKAAMYWMYCFLVCVYGCVFAYACAVVVVVVFISSNC